MVIKFSSLILILLFLSIGINTGTVYNYLFFVLITLLTFFYIVRKGSIFKDLSFEDSIPLGFILLWIYGLVLGLLKGNRIEYIVANNAGMVLYFLYYIIIQYQIPKRLIFKLLVWSSFSICLITILLYSFNVFGISSGPISLLLGDFVSGSSTGQRRIYFVSQMTLYPALALYLAVFLSSRNTLAEELRSHNVGNRFWVIACVLAFTLCLVFFTASKGFMLGYIFLLFILPIGLYSKGLSEGRVNRNIIIFLVLIFILVITLLSFGYFNIITSIVDSDDDANLLRYEQFIYLIDDLTFWGKGLGSVIPGYFRNEDKPYGFELSYLSLIHKFGVFSIVAIALYVVTIVRALKNLFIGHEVMYSSVAIGAMCYLLPSIGNPLLFAPQAVVLHCLAIYLLKKRLHA